MATNGNGNGGITKPISDTVKALAGTPMLLVLVVLNILILGMITYLLKVRGEALRMERSELVQTLEKCMDKLNHGP